MNWILFVALLTVNEPGGWITVVSKTEYGPFRSQAECSEAQRKMHEALVQKEEQFYTICRMKGEKS